MKKGKQREILIVPPGNAKSRIIRVPRRALLFFFLVIAGGFAGYLIPFNSFTLDVVEQNQRKNLEQQNKKLLAAIRPMHRLLDNLNDQIEQLDAKRKAITNKIGTHQHPAGEKNKRKTVSTGFNDLIVRVQRTESVFLSLSQKVSQGSGFFDSVPVIKPVVDSVVIGAGFEQEKDPFTGIEKNHYGIDLIARLGTPVIAPASGTVTRIEDSRIWGKRITINHAYGFSTVFAHCGTVEVFTGKKVRKGDRIATVGISGITSGPHLHYEIWYKGMPVNPQDIFFPSCDSAFTVVSR